MQLLVQIAELGMCSCQIRFGLFTLLILGDRGDCDA